MRILSVLMIMFMGLSTVALGQSADGDLPNVKKILNHSDVLKMRDGLLGAFPPGTPRGTVHQALIDAGAEYKGQAKESDLSHKYTEASNAHAYRYQKPWYLCWLHNGAYVIGIHFDKNDRLKKKRDRRDGKYQVAITVSGPGAL